MVAPFSNCIAPSLVSYLPILRPMHSGSSGASSGCSLKGLVSSSTANRGSSFSFVVSRNVNVVPPSCLVQEALAPSIPMRKDVISKLPI
jgi:hypothetical protein